MTNETRSVVELYPKILVYKNMFDNPLESYDVLRNSLTDTEDRLFSPWTQWSIFGEYLNPIIPGFQCSGRYGNMENAEAVTETQMKQKKLGMEVMENFHSATLDYVEKMGVEVDFDATTVDENGSTIPVWHWTGGTIGKYNVSDEKTQYRMTYHSDYIREQAEAPGYKFAITCTMYFNDDYEGGEIDFAIGKKLVKYKPEAGDVLVFPSGHPDYLTEDGIPYLHGVMPAYGSHKFLARMYWQKYQPATPQWYEREKEFGKERWADMQKDLEEQFRMRHPQRWEIPDGIRVV